MKLLKGRGQKLRFCQDFWKKPKRLFRDSQRDPQGFLNLNIFFFFRIYDRMKWTYVYWKKNQMQSYLTILKVGWFFNDFWEHKIDPNRCTQIFFRIFLGLKGRFLSSIFTWPKCIFFLIIFVRNRNRYLGVSKKSQEPI